MTEDEEDDVMLDILADIFLDKYLKEIKQRKLSQVDSKSKPTPPLASPPPCIHL